MLRSFEVLGFVWLINVSAHSLFIDGGGTGRCLSQGCFPIQNQKVSPAAQGPLLFVDETPLVLWHILSAALKNTLLDLMIQTVPQEVVTHTTEHMMAKINASLSG